MSEEPGHRLSGRFADALAYAAAVHDGQVREGTAVPYLSHLLAVASLVLEDGGDEDEAIAALLHDAAEDQGGEARLEDIGRRFGPTVAAIVEGCSDTLEDPKPEWRPRKEAHLAHLQRAAADVLRVEAADKVHNARSVLSDYRRLGDGLWSRFSGGRDGTLWYYRSMRDLLLVRAPGPLADEVDRLVAELDRLLV